MKKFNLWVWRNGEWKVEGAFKTSEAAKSAGRELAKDSTVGSFSVATVGSQKDDHIRARTKEEDAPLT